MNKKGKTRRNTAKDPRILTDTEFQVMNILWHLPEGKGFTTDVLAKYEDPKPAYTTLATFLKILEKKDFVECRKLGAMLYYTPKLSFEDYRVYFLERVGRLYFDGDMQAFAQLVGDLARA